MLDLTTELQVAETFSVTICTIRRWIAKGKIPEPMRIGRKRYWHTEQLQTWIDEQYVEAKNLDEKVAPQ